MPVFHIRNGMFTSDSLILVNGRVSHKHCALSKRTQPSRAAFNAKTITFKLPSAGLPALSDLTGVSNREPCVFCGLPEDKPTGNMCKSCVDLATEGVQDVVAASAK